MKKLTTKYEVIVKSKDESSSLPIADAPPVESDEVPVVAVAGLKIDDSTPAKKTEIVTAKTAEIVVPEPEAVEAAENVKENPKKRGEKAKAARKRRGIVIDYVM